MVGALTALESWLPAPDELGAPGIPGRHRVVRELHGELARFVAIADPVGRAAAFEGLLRWLCRGASPPSARGPAATHPFVERLRLLVSAFERHEPLKRRVESALTILFQEASTVKLFGELGLPNDRGLLPELSDRLARRLLPQPPDLGDLAQLVARVVRRPRDKPPLHLVSEPLIARFARLFPDSWARLRAAVDDALALLGARVTALGLTSEIRDRDDAGGPRASPFYRISHAPARELPELVAECRRHIALVYERLERTGVSVDVVYCLEAISRSLDRIELLRPLLVEEGEKARAGSIRALLVTVAAAEVESRSLLAIVRSSLRLLARKVIERVGETGEHYVTTTRSEYWKMIGSAAGGGVLTAGTCVVKFFTKWGGFSLFVEGALASLDYAASFVLMQLCGFTLATKQPSMTAAALAGAIRERRGADRLNDLAALITRISRSQVAAAIGNIVMVIPAATAFDVLWVRAHGRHFLDLDTANYVIASFHPLHSGTLPYAALTGVLLWMSSLAAGWFENWVTYRRLPQAIEHHRLGHLIGRRRTRAAGRFLAHHAAGFGGNVSLGVLLGMTPVLGAFFGLPLDVRHVTLSTGALTLAACSVGTAQVLTATFAWSAAGILAIGLLNFGISFVMALAVAMRAREVGARERLALLREVGRRFVRRPAAFFYPPRGG
jgi:site-specific recombinase